MPIFVLSDSGTAKLKDFRDQFGGRQLMLTGELRLAIATEQNTTSSLSRPRPRCGLLLKKSWPTRINMSLRRRIIVRDTHIPDSLSREQY